MMRYHSQKGFLLIVAVLLIIAIGFFGSAMIHIFMGTAESTSRDKASGQTFYIAESGLERGLYELLANKTLCSNINAVFPSPVSFGGGQFQITATHYKPLPTGVLSNAINATTSTIPVTSTVGYVSQGRVLIGKELIDYTGKTATSFTGAARGQDGTVAMGHSDGYNVYQDLCVLQAKGGLPTIASPTASHTIIKEFFKGQNALSRAGGKAGDIYNYDGNSWSLEANVGPNDLYWIGCLNADECWAMGLNGTIYHYDGMSWSLYHTVPGSYHLFGGFCRNASDCWAVGESGRIYHYDGVAWTLSDDVGNSSLAEIECLAADDCWTAGTLGQIFHYDGVSWSGPINMPGALIIYGLTCNSPTDCWAVGESGKIYHYNGVSWGVHTTTASGQSLFEVFCTTPNDCWTVGAAGEIYRYNGATDIWSLNHTVGGQTLRFVMCMSTNDCWAVGDSGKIYHYNGSWSLDQNVNDDLLTVATEAVNSPTWIWGWKEVIK